MKNIYTVVIVLIVTVFTSCSPTTNLLSSWTNEEKTNNQFDKIAIAAIFPSSSNRYLTENAIVSKLRANRIKTIPTYEILPLAGRLDEVQSLMKDTSYVENRIKEKVKEHKIDALMIVTLLHLDKKERYVSSTHNSYFSVGPGYYYGGMYPNAYYNYYTYSVGNYYTPGYYVEDVTYYLECSLFSVENEDLLWSGRTKTSGLTNVEDEAQKFSEVIVNELISKKIIVPKRTLD